MSFSRYVVLIVFAAMLANGSTVSAQQAAPSAVAPAAPAAIVQPVTPPSVAPSPQNGVQPAPAVEPREVGEPRGASAKVSTGLPSELSPWSMFMSADIIVKLVIIGLAFASLLTWTTFFAKTIQIHLAQSRLTAALSRISSAKTLAEAKLALGPAHNIVASLLGAAVHELRLSSNSVVESGIKERAASIFSDIARIEMRSVRRGIGILATIGATSPFIGLFGTVWGIMNSFIGISKAQTTNLAVVAPGIAEALLATAIGLVAAIPAVIMYNHLSRSTKGYFDLVNRTSGQVGRLLSRDLDHNHVAGLSRAAE